MAYFANLPMPYTEKELDLALAIYRITGAIEARNSLILRHIRLGFHIAKKYGIKYPDLKDDLISVSVEGVVHAVESLRGNLHPTPSKYITLTVHGFLKWFLEHRKIVYIPRRAKSRHVLISEITGLYKNTEEKLDKGLTVPPNHDETLITTTVERLKLTKLEQQILELRLQDFTIIEIALMLRRSTTFVRCRLQDIGKKYENLGK